MTVINGDKGGKKKKKLARKKLRSVRIIRDTIHLDVNRGTY